MNIKNLFPLIALFLLCCDPILNKVSDIPKDYIRGLNLDSTKIENVDVYINKIGPPVVACRYNDKYKFVIFSKETNEHDYLVDLLAFETKESIGITPNISYKGSGVGYVEVRYPINYPLLRSERTTVITEPGTHKFQLELNDSTRFIFLEKSRGFELRSEGESYSSVVVNVLDDQLANFGGHTDLGILVYRRADKDYVTIIYSRNSNDPVLQLDELFDTLNIHEIDLEN